MKSRNAMVRAICGVKLKDNRNVKDFIEMLGLNFLQYHWYSEVSDF